MADVMMYDSDVSFEDDFVDDESDFDSDFDDDENVAPVKKGKAPSAAAKKATTKKTAATSKKSSKKDAAEPVLADKSGNVPATKEAGGKTKKTIEETYQKKTQLEHILLRPDTYIGSVEPVTQPMFVLNTETDRIVQQEITFTPGLYKIFDEILVNAADNKQRDSNMDKLDVEIDQAANTISVKNNGQGIPVEMHKEHKCYVPTLIFGHLLTGSNFDDDEKKTTGGRNGYGAKLANIFSTEFIVECVDAGKGLKFKQVFRDNMTKAEDATIKPCTKTEKKQGDYTKITFSPDLQRFKMARLDDDAVALLSKRAYDIAGSMASREGKKLAVTLNGKKLPVKDFKSYLSFFDGLETPVAYEKVNDRWEVGVSTSLDGSFRQVSFVNAICTSKGGGHVTYIADQVADKLKAVVKKKNKGGAEIKPNQIKNHLCIFVNCLVENPAFDSQTKENLTTRPKSFGSQCKLSDKFMKQVEKSSVIDAILAFAKFKQGQALKRQGGTKKNKITGITKLDDANFAGSAKSKECTLIVTEGDSAKSLAMSGLSVVGRDYYGVFPLKGKPLNVREATHKQIMNNEEIKNLVEILGLKYHVKYDESNIKTLRYGHLMIMADQDHDGSHIKGLMINFIHHFWPSLLDVPGFLQQFITPIVKASKGKKAKTFFTLPEYEAWKESTGNDAKGYKIKYYKGLGTSTSAEAKEYFSNLDLHEVHFGDLTTDVRNVEVEEEERNNDSDDEMDFENDISNAAPEKVVSGNDLITMAFSKKHVEDRKTWLNNLKKDTYLNYSKAQQDGVRFSDFINKELILFSQADNQRSIPHVMDGFKPSQRKILFSCFKRKLKGEIKVAQLVGYVGEHSAYHHGEASLQGTIINMAQSFCGSNNVNLLTPSGQFGTRRMGGKDAASPRYIFTKLEKITRTIFHPDDDALLNYLNDDGLSIEPEYYMPVIPMVLVNGSEGIGTGWSSSVPTFDPRAIIANLRRLMDGEELEKMSPHFNGFTGDVIAESGKREGSYIVKGEIERTDDETLKITELPVKKWTQDYKVFLESLLTGDPKKKDSEAEIKDFKENHTDTTVSFTIKASKEKIDSFEKGKDGLYGKFKLSTTVSTSNMNLFDPQAKIYKYSTPEDILKEFFKLRIEFYEKRKEHLLGILRREKKMLANKARFVEEVCSGDLIVSNRKRSDILSDLQERGYDTFSKDDEKRSGEDEEDDESDDDGANDSASDAELAKGYEYLLGMKIWSLTFEKAEKLRAELEEKKQAVADLEATSPDQIWATDLDAIEEALNERDADMAAEAKEERKAQSKNRKLQAKAAKKKATKGKKKKRADEWDSEMESSDEEMMSDDSGDSDDFMAAAKKAPAKKKAPAAKPPAKKAPVAKKAPAKKAPAKKAAAAAPAPKPAPKPTEEIVQSDSDSDSDVSSSLLNRLKERMIVSPDAKKLAVRVQDDDDDGAASLLSTSSSAGSRKRPSPREGAAAKSKKKPATKKAKKPAKKKAVIDLSSDSEMDFVGSDSESEPNSAPPAPRPARARRGAAAKAKSYKFDESDSDGSEFSDY